MIAHTTNTMETGVVKLDIAPILCVQGHFIRVSSKTIMEHVKSDCEVSLKNEVEKDQI